MQNFSIIKTEDLSSNIVREVEAQLHVNIDENSCFLKKKSGDLYFYRYGFGKNLNCVWIWFDDCWIISETYSTRTWFKYFSNLMDDQIKGSIQEKSKLNLKSINVLDMIAQFTDEEFARLPIDVRLEIVSNLVRDGVKKN